LDSRKIFQTANLLEVPPLKKALFVFLVWVLIPFTVYAKPESLKVDLDFKPRDSVKVHPKNVPPSKIFFEPVQDARPNPRSIGENLEDKGQKVNILASNEPAGFVRSVLIKEFRNRKFSVEDNAGAASKIVAGTLVKFWTVETSNYDSQIQMRIEVKDRSGRVHFSRTYPGVGKNRGRSLSDTNYNESISNSMTSMIDKIFSDQEFLNSLSETSALSGAGGKPAAVAAESQPAPAKKSKRRSPPTQAPPKTQPVFGPK
jgi:hypothetical protein